LSVNAVTILAAKGMPATAQNAIAAEVKGKK
jgi:hypothetical protein